MRRALLVVLLAFAAVIALARQPSIERGRDILERSECLTCHRFAGGGPGKGSDLLFTTGGEWTRSAFIASLWNHGSSMFARFEKEKREPVRLVPDDLADLFAALDARRAFAAEPKGSAAKGRALFAARGCASCHERLGVTMKPVASLEQLGVQLWRDIPGMRELVKKDDDWPHLSGADVRDLLAFVEAGSKPR